MRNELRESFKIYLIEIHQERTLWSFVFQNLFCQLIKSLHLILRLLDDPLQCAKITRWSPFIKQINVNVFGNWVFALVDRFQQSRLPAAVFSQKTISPTVGELEGRICNQNSPMEH